jgi:superfamily II DNA or RNA helicase
VDRQPQASSSAQQTSNHQTSVHQPARREQPDTSSENQPQASSSSQTASANDIEATTQTHGDSTPTQDGVVDLTNTDTAYSRFMVSKDDVACREEASDSQQITSHSQEPRFRIDDLGQRTRRVCWLSGDVHDDQPDDEELRIQDEGLRKLVSDCTEISHSEWLEFCNFFQYDPRQGDARWCVYFPGWKPQFALKPFQAYTVWLMMRKILDLHMVIILDAGMGVGKTAISIACIMTYHTMFRPIEGRRHFPKPIGPGLSYFNAPSLIVVPNSTIMTHWAAELSKFPETSSGWRFKIVIAHSLPGPRDYAPGGRYAGCYHIGDNLRPEDMPSDAELEQAFGSTWQTRKEAGISVKWVLHDSTRDRLLRSLWSTFVVLTTKESLIRKFPDPVKAPDWGLIFVDEFHSAIGVRSAPWNSIGRYYRHGPVIGLSGTPYRKLDDLTSIIFAGTHRFYKPRDEDIEDTATIYDKRPQIEEKDFPSNMVLDIDYLLSIPPESSRFERLEMISKHLAALDWSDVRSSAKMINKELSGETLKMSIFQTDTDEIEVVPNSHSKAPFEQRELDIAVSKCSAWLRPITIRWHPHHRWAPPLMGGRTPGIRPMPLLPMPQHNAFDIWVKIEEPCALIVDELWKRMAADPAKGSQFLMISQMMVALTFPDLFRLMHPADEVSRGANPDQFDQQELRRSQRLREEIPDVGVATAGKVSTIASTTLDDLPELKAVMPILHQSPQMTALRTGIARARKLKNGLDKNLKQVIGAYKPMNAALIYRVSCSVDRLAGETR